MSFRLEMLQVARLSTKLLGDATSLIVDFLRSTQNGDGGFSDRGGSSDLYYSVFAIEALYALHADLPLPAFSLYLKTFEAGDGLDFVHLCCLARCWASVRDSRLAKSQIDSLLSKIEACRAPDGGYAARPGDPIGTIYHSFLALGAYQDLGATAPESQRVLDCVNGLRLSDGGFANQRDLPVGLTPPTAAAVTLQRHFEQSPDLDTANWLFARHLPQGGFFATPDAPIPDLLSTATALHALSGLHQDLEPVRSPCLDFIDTLWTTRGGFLGSWEDETLDAEYTYYGLLALGHLAV